MSKQVDLDGLWVLGLTGRVEATLYNAGISSISKLKVLVQTGSIGRFRGIGPAALDDIKHALTVYDEALKGLPPDNGFKNRGWTLRIGRTVNQVFEALVEHEYLPGYPIPSVGDFIMHLPNMPQTCVVAGVYYSWADKIIVIVVAPTGNNESEDNKENEEPSKNELR